jgi:hypothetical protein
MEQFDLNLRQFFFKIPRLQIFKPDVRFVSTFIINGYLVQEIAYVMVLDDDHACVQDQDCREYILLVASTGYWLYRTRLAIYRDGTFVFGQKPHLMSFGNHQGTFLHFAIEEKRFNNCMKELLLLSECDELLDVYQLAKQTRCVVSPYIIRLLQSAQHEADVFSR